MNFLFFFYSFNSYVSYLRTECTTDIDMYVLFVYRKRSHSASSSTGSDVSDDVHIVSHKKRSYRDRERKMDEVERLAEMERQR